MGKAARACKLTDRLTHSHEHRPSLIQTRVRAAFSSCIPKVDLDDETITTVAQFATVNTFIFLLSIPSSQTVRRHEIKTVVDGSVQRYSSDQNSTTERKIFFSSFRLVSYAIRITAFIEVRFILFAHFCNLRVFHFEYLIHILYNSFVLCNFSKLLEYIQRLDYSFRYFIRIDLKLGQVFEFCRVLNF